MRWPSVFYKQLIPLLVEICKLFLSSSKPIHALLASKRRPIGLQKMPFKPLTNALLKFNEAPFVIHLCNSLIPCLLKAYFLHMFSAFILGILLDFM